MKKAKRRQFWRVGGPVAQWMSLTIPDIGTFSIIDLSYGGVGFKLDNTKNLEENQDMFQITLHLINADIELEGKVRYRSKKRIGMSFQHKSAYGFKALKDTIGFFRAGMQSRFSPIQNESGMQVYVGELPCYLKLKTGLDPESNQIEVLNGSISFMDIDGRFAKVDFDQVLGRLATERLSAALSHEPVYWHHNSRPLVFAEVNVHHFNSDILKKAIFLMYGFAFGNLEYADSVHGICVDWVQKIYSNFEKQKIGA